MDCMNNDGSINSTDYFPINSDEPLPPNPLLEEHAIGSGHRTQTVSNKTDLNLVSYHACSCYSQLLVYWRSLLSFSLLFYRPFVLSFFNFRVYLSWRFSLALALFFFLVQSTCLLQFWNSTFVYPCVLFCFISHCIYGKVFALVLALKFVLLSLTILTILEFAIIIYCYLLLNAFNITDYSNRINWQLFVDICRRRPLSTMIFSNQKRRWVKWPCPRRKATLTRIFRWSISIGNRALSWTLTHSPCRLTAMQENRWDWSR